MLIVYDKSILSLLFSHLSEMALIYLVLLLFLFEC